MTERKLHVPVEPLPEARWERLERRILEERARDRETAPAPELRPWSRRLAPAAALAGALAGAAAVWFTLGARAPELPGPPPIAGGATRLATPEGAPTRLTLGGAVVNVGGGTEVAWRVADDGTTVLELERGGVDCEVAPRAARAPFHVVAADVVVTVVGTRFTVERNGGVKVSVAHGQVRVKSTRGDEQVAAGQAWDLISGPKAAAIASGGDALARVERDPEPEPDARAPATQPIGAADPIREQELANAEAAADPAAAYRALAEGNDVTAAEAQFRLIQHERERGSLHQVVRLTDEYERRFPGGPHLEEVLWLRVHAYCDNAKSDAAERAARAYLKKFPRGRHVEAAGDPAVCSRL